MIKSHTSAGFIFLRLANKDAVAVRYAEIVAMIAYDDSTALLMTSGNMFCVRESAEEILATIGG